jgi:hypothetical protein
LIAAGGDPTEPAKPGLLHFYHAATPEEIERVLRDYRRETAKQEVLDEIKHRFQVGRVAIRNQAIAEAAESVKGAFERVHRFVEEEPRSQRELGDLSQKLRSWSNGIRMDSSTELAALQAHVDLCRQFVEWHPRSQKLQFELGMVLLQLAARMTRQAHTPEAVKHEAFQLAKEAILAQTAAYRLSNRDRYAANSLYSAYGSAIEMSMQMGRHVQAFEFAQQIAALDIHPWRDAFQAASELQAAAERLSIHRFADARPEYDRRVISLLEQSLTQARDMQQNAEFLRELDTYPPLAAFRQQPAYEQLRQAAKAH